MKTNNNHNSASDCRFGETLVAVLYGEADAARTEKFYSHLDDCAVCLEELVAFGSLKNSIADWRETQFLPLAAPEIVLPRESQNEIWRETDKSGWLDSVRAFFATLNLNWQTAAACFAGFLVVGYLTIVIVSQMSRPESEIVSVLPVPTVTATPEIKTSPKPTPAETNSAGAENPSQLISQPPDKSESAPVRVAQKQTKTNRATAAVKDDAPKRKIPVTKQQPQQNFADIGILSDDAEDNSPRLTDLLDEVEPST